MVGQVNASCGYIASVNANEKYAPRGVGGYGGWHKVFMASKTKIKNSCAK